MLTRLSHLYEHAAQKSSKPWLTIVQLQHCGKQTQCGRRDAGRTTSMLLSRACWHRSLQ